MKAPANSPAVIYRLIGSVKVATGLLLILAGAGLFKVVPLLQESGLEPALLRLHLDSENRLIYAVASKLSALTPARLKLIGFGTFFYAGLHLTEGVGLLLLKRWAEYFTVIASGALLPVELYEIYERVTWLRLLIFAGNVAVVAYLVVRLRSEHRERMPAQN